MTYRAELDILLHFHSLSTLIFRKQGLLKIRAFIFYSNDKGQVQTHLIQQMNAHPYSIIKKKPEQRTFDSYIDEASQGYYSHSILASYEPDQYLLQEACLFRAYIPVDKVDQLQLFCTVQLLYCPDYLETEKSVFEIFGEFSARIKKPSRFADFMPVSFDEFEGCTLRATYHSTILEFKFIKQEDDENNGYYDFWSYMDAITSGFQKASIRRFYSYYRSRIEDEFAALQEMYAQIRKVSGEPEQPRLKFIHNAKLQNEMDWLTNTKSTSFSTEVVNKLIQKIMMQFTILKGVCYKCWNEYIGFVLQHSSKIATYYMKSYRQRVIERLKTNVFSHIVKGKNWTLARYNDCGQSNLQQAQKERSKDYGELWAEQFSIQNIEYFQDQHKAVKIFQQSYSINPQSVKNQNVPFLHVFVLVHGFQASHKDFTLVKNYLLAREEPTQVLLSNVNEGRTNFNIQTLGSRLAVEVADFLNNKLTKQKFRLSFIGHSLGGIIIRTALRHLERFWPYLYSYISFSTPHLGYLGVSSKVIEAGLWYLNNWEKCHSIRQLMMIDAPDPAKSFLFRLSEQDALKHFRNVAFVSSYQDGFVSHQSARVEKSEQMTLNSSRNDPKAAILCDMTDSILSRIQNLYRIDVVFQIDEKNLDSLLGRTGHIKFLSDSHFLKIFINTFDHLFK